MQGSAFTPKPAAPNPNEKLVRVFDTEQESEAMVVRGLLESAGIDSDITALDAPQDVLPGVGGTVILVRQEDAEAARKLIEVTGARPIRWRPRNSKLLKTLRVSADSLPRRDRK